MAKRAKLREIVGKVEEEEPEGEAVVGPSGEVTVLVLHTCSSHSHCYQFMCTNFFSFQHFMTAYFTLELLVSRPQTKEEEDIDFLCSWVQVGGFLLI